MKTEWDRNIPHPCLETKQLRKGGGLRVDTGEVQESGDADTKGKAGFNGLARILRIRRWRTRHGSAAAAYCTRRLWSAASSGCSRWCAPSMGAL